MVEKAKLEQSPFGMVLTNNSNSKTNRNKTVNKNKQDKRLFYNICFSFENFKDINDFKELSLDSMHKKLNDFRKNFNRLKMVSPQTKTNVHLKEKALDNGGNFFKDLYYIYKERCKEEKSG